jgi:hypothetical protein
MSYNKLIHHHFDLLIGMFVFKDHNSREGFSKKYRRFYRGEKFFASSFSRA